MEYGSRYAGKQIEDRINHASPAIFQNEAGEPEKRHIADEMDPTSMKKHRGQLGRKRSMRGDKSVIRQNRGLLLL